MGGLTGDHVGELRLITSSLRRRKRAAAWEQGVAGSGWGLENSQSQRGVVAGCSERPGVGPADTGSPPHRSSWLGDFAPGRQPLRLCAENKQGERLSCLVETGQIRPLKS